MCYEQALHVIMHFILETTTGMGFSPGMGITWKSHGDGKKTPTWQLEWEGVEMNVDGTPTDFSLL